MDPNHMNWHRFTLLHHMAAEGELGKARPLLDHGADIDAVDDEYCSTPLGVAARRGQAAAVELLLERGADPDAAGAPWATPLVWARKKGHDRVETLLRASGAHDAER
jgi:ankyrin repeat protein